MNLIVIKGFTFTDHFNIAVEAVSAQGTPYDGLLPGYYNGLQWLYGDAPPPYLFQASAKVHERVV